MSITCTCAQTHSHRFSSYSKHTAKYGAHTFVFVSPHARFIEAAKKMALHYNTYNMYMIFKDEFHANYRTNGSIGRAWSTGYYAILDLQRKHKDAELHVFGMCWPKKCGFPAAKERRLIANMTDVVVHPTPSNVILAR